MVCKECLLAPVNVRATGLCITCSVAETLRREREDERRAVITSEPHREDGEE